ncbi:MAG: rod shape-determining protein [Planctomycetes bacterium]|nr:rod shape-determining protein [Planctomycetota bacterium]
MQPNANAPASKPSDGVLFVGIDLGTSHSAVAASNGVRKTVDSIVAYPRDLISTKALGKDKLFGADAWRHKHSCDVYRPMEKGDVKYRDLDTALNRDAGKTKQAVRDLLEHVVKQADPRPDDLVYGVIGAPAQASIHSQKTLIEAARGILDCVMICSEPFAVAYGLQFLTDTLVIDIGAGTTDLCRMHGSLPAPEDQRTVSAAGDAVDRKLFELLKEACPGASFTVNMLKQIKEKHAALSRVDEPVKVTLPVKGIPTEFDITNAIKQAVESIVPEIVEGLHELIADYDPEFQASMRDNVLLAGGGSQIIGLDRAIEKKLNQLGGGKVTKVGEPVYAGANGALNLAQDMPAEFWQQLINDEAAVAS